MKQADQNNIVLIIGDMDLFSQMINELLDEGITPAEYHDLMTALAHMRAAVKFLKDLECERIYEWDEGKAS